MTRDSVYFQGQEKLNQWLARVVKETSDLKPLFDDLGDILLDGIHDRFDRGVAPNGKPWQKSWRAIAQGGKTGRDTGRLLNSFFAKTSNGGVQIATNVVYAPWFHYGAVITPKSKPHLKFRTPKGGWVSAKRVVNPARPILGVSEDDAQNTLLEIEDYLEKVLKDAKR